MGKTPKRKRLTARKKVLYRKSTTSTKANVLAKERSSRSAQTRPDTTSATPSSLITSPSATPSSTTSHHLTTPTPASRSTKNNAQLFWNPPNHDTTSASEDDATPPTSPSRTSLHTPTTADRIRITRKNAVYDSVVGAMRGSKPLEIPRTRPLREPIDDIARNTRRFNRIITDIITRCERLGEETGCWLLFLAQLPSSKALTHYSSSRLRREAKSDTLRVINQYQAVIRSLLAAKRDEAVNIQKRFEETQRDLENIRHELARKDAELASLRGAAST
ncbi:hypothetical protein H0H92_011352 [Tricholoma furcatifolium]|nr:hypothetical protein H0H92_011352 [Tricholoma furcatifolium]